MGSSAEGCWGGVRGALLRGPVVRGALLEGWQVRAGRGLRGASLGRAIPAREEGSGASRVQLGSSGGGGGGGGSWISRAVGELLGWL